MPEKKPEVHEEVATVEITEKQMLSMRYQEVVNEAIEEALDEQPYFYRPYEKHTDAQLDEELEKCTSDCVAAKLKNEKPEPQIEGRRRDINREKRIRSGEIPPQDAA